MTTRNLDALFNPHAIALIGASRRPGSVGAVVTRNLLQGGFAGRVMLVNSRGGEIAGQTVYAEIAALPQAPDLAVVATPAGTVPDVIAQLGARGCRAAVVISAGFEGDGPPARLKRAMLDAARPHLLRIVGPNCLGLISPVGGVNGSFASGMPPTGRVALVAQSGAIAVAAMDSAAGLGFGFSHVVTVGDCADVDVGDLLDWLALDRQTDAILLYLEGISDARKFMSAARVAARTKPVAVLKAGRSDSGARAALSHTGALAGAFAVYEAAFRRSGLLQVDDLGDLLRAGAAFAAGLKEAGDRLAVLTNGGGAGVLAADALELRGERTCDLTPQTVAALSAIAPSNWSRRNPVDILGDAGPPTYAAALKVLLAAPEVDAVMVLNCPTAVADSAEIARAVAEASKGRGRKPVLTAWLGGEAVAEARRTLAAAGLPTYATPEEAARIYSLLACARRRRELLVHAPAAIEVSPDAPGARRIIEQAQAEGRKVLTDPETRSVLKAYGVPVLNSLEVRTPDEAAAAAEALGGRIALKILSRQITHKSDIGGVALDLVGREATLAAARRMLAAVASKRPEAIVDGFVVEPMTQRPHAQEVLAGIVQDPTFGPVVMVGHGGVGVEILADRALGLPPLNADLAREMIDKTRVSRLLAGYRDRRPADLTALARALVALGQLAADLPQIGELDVNPLLCDAEGVLAVDGRIVLQSSDQVSARMAIVPYPAQLARKIKFEGRPLTIRPVRPSDAGALGAMIEACSPQDVRFRFGAALRRLWPELAATLTQIDYDRQLALVADDGGGALAGVGWLCADPEGESAEFALMVRTDRQRHGLGGLLLRTLLDYGRQRGLTRVWGDTEIENGHMLELARSMGFEVGPSVDPCHLRLVRHLNQGVEAA